MKIKNILASRIATTPDKEAILTEIFTKIDWGISPAEALVSVASEHEYIWDADTQVFRPVSSTKPDGRADQ